MMVNSVLGSGLLFNERWLREYCSETFTTFFQQLFTFSKPQYYMWFFKTTDFYIIVHITQRVHYQETKVMISPEQTEQFLNRPQDFSFVGDHHNKKAGKPFF
jgi:hypothetical protein